MGIQRIISGITDAIFLKMGRKRAMKISVALNKQRDQQVTVWAMNAVPRSSPWIPIEKRQDISKSICRAYRLGSDMARARAVRELEKALGDTAAYRAANLLDTELTRMTGYAALYDMRQAGFKKKVWMCTRDGFSRRTHAALDGQIVPVDSPFVSTSGATAMHPGDFGVPEEDEGCRCAIRAILPGEIDPETGKSIE